MIECRVCGTNLDESYPRWIDDIGEMCLDCAFKSGAISGNEYLQYHGLSMPSARAEVRNGEIHVVINSKFDWEVTDKRIRFTADYERWRQDVFVRDNFTCSMCGKHGSTLNAHHKKSYKDYPELRLDVDNGTTLCLECHRKIHAKGG